MKNKIIFVLCLLYGLLMINAGVNKIFEIWPMPEEAPERMKEMMSAMKSMGWLLPLLGLAEIVGGLLFIIPKYRLIGALVLLPVTLGILSSHIVNEPGGIPVALIVLAINVWVLIDGRQRLLGLIRPSAQ